MSEAQSFGDVVGQLRSVLSLSRSAAAEKLQMSEAMLEDIETGLIPGNPLLKAAFEEAYGLDLDGVSSVPRENVPRRPLDYDEETGILQIGELSIEFRVGDDDNDHLLRHFSAALRQLRRLSPSTPLRLRAADLPVLARLIDLDDPELDSRARFWFGQDSREAQRFSTLLKVSRPPVYQS